MDIVFDQYVNQASQYQDFCEYVSNHTNKEKGDLQEIYVKYYFLSQHSHDVDKYYSRVCDNIPEDLNVPMEDFGTDGYIIHKDGMISLVQVKYRSNSRSRIHRDAVSGMALESRQFIRSDQLKHLYVVANVDKSPLNITSTEKDSWDIKYILAEALMETNWEKLKAYWNNREHPEVPIVLELPPLRLCQERALSFLGSFGRDFGRKRAHLPCGSGKSRIALEVIKRYDRILWITPTLHLLSQAFNYLSSFLYGYRFILVGSDMSNEQEDEGYRVPYTLTTDSEDIGNFIEENERCIVISTYNSLPQIDSSIEFDVTICDEAHRCCVSKTSYYAIPVHKDFPCDNILYLTATPKVFNNDGETLYSMNTEEHFGEAFVYGFREAINDGVISDYKVITSHTDDFQDNFSENSNFNAKFIAKAILKEDLRSVLVFSSNHKESVRLTEDVRKEFQRLGINHRIILMVERATSDDKVKAIRAVEKGEKVVIFNVRVFTLGSDIPKLESVVLCGGKSSKIDIIQSICRCLRISEGKTCGKILVPCLIDGDDYEGSGSFKDLRLFLASLGSIDGAIIDEIFVKRKNPNDLSGGNRIHFLDIRNSVEDYVGDIDFDKITIKAFNRLSLGFGILSPERKFDMVMANVIKTGSLLGVNFVEDGIRIGGFLYELLQGKCEATRKNEKRVEWLQELLKVTTNSLDIIRIKFALGLLIKQNDDSEEVFKMICSHVKEHNGKLPATNFITAEGVKMGTFLMSLISGGYGGVRKEWEDSISKNRIEWLQILLDITKYPPDIKRIEKALGRAEKTFSKATLEEIFSLVETGGGCFPNSNSATSRGVKISYFFDKMLRSDNKTDTLLKEVGKTKRVWIRELLEVTKRDKDRERLMKFLGDIEAVKMPSPTEKFEMLLSYLEEREAFPSCHEIVDGVKLGVFANSIFGRVSNKKYREEWLQILLEKYGETKIGPRIKGALFPELQTKKNHTSPSVKYELLVEHVRQNNGNLPSVNHSSGLGHFLRALRRGDCHRQNRKQWLEGLLEVVTNPEDIIVIEKALGPQNDNKGKEELDD